MTRKRKPSFDASPTRLAANRLVANLDTAPAILEDAIALAPPERVEGRAIEIEGVLQRHDLAIEVLDRRAQAFIDQEEPAFDRAAIDDTGLPPMEDRAADPAAGAPPRRNLEEASGEDGGEPDPGGMPAGVASAVDAIRTRRENLIHRLSTLVDADWEREAALAGSNTYTPLTLARQACHADALALAELERLLTEGPS